MWDYGPENRGSEMAIISIVMAVISVVAVSMRSYTMAKLLKRFLFEDWLAVVTCLLQCAFCVLVVIGCSFGLGAHVDYVPEVNRPKALIFKWAGQVAYIVVSTLVKFVVGIFLLRLCVNNNWQRITIIVLLVIVGLFNTFYVFLAIFQCQPIEFYWYRYDPDAPVTGKCNGHTLATVPTYFAVLIGIASDLILALLPATLIKGANLDKKTKISVCCVLALGSLASVATIARIPYAKQLLSNPDYLYNFTDLAIWSIVECGIAITASSLATLRPLFIKMKLLASSHFTTRFQSSGMNSTGLPMQSARSGPITVISSHTKRNTAMTGTTALSGSTAVTGAMSGLTSVKEYQDGIQVEKEFEMSIITRENSEDSIDRLEAEVNEVIRPGTAKRKASQDRFSSRRNSLTPRPRPAPLQTSFEGGASASPTTTTTISAGSSTSGHRYAAYNTPTSSSPQPQRRPSNGFNRSDSFGQPQTPTSTYGGVGSAYTDTVMRSPPPSLPQAAPRRHQYSNSEDHAHIQTTPGTTFSPPNFHLPTRLQHQSIMSNQSMMSTSTSHYSRGTFGGSQGGSVGLSAPPRLTQSSMGDYVPNYTDNTTNNSPTASPLGSPVSLVTRVPHRVHSRSGSSPASPTSASPVSGVRFPFQRPIATSDTVSNSSSSSSSYNHHHHNAAARSSSSSTGRRQKQRGKQRVNTAFFGDDPSASTMEMHGYREQGDILEEMDESPPWMQRPQDESPSPLRSHPPLSPKGNWV